MNELPPASNAPRRANPVLWLVIGLPLLAVVASFTSLALAITRGDKDLPANYHWEGPALARADARAAAAAALGVTATIRIGPGAAGCSVELRGATPAALRLTLTHPTEQSLDRRIELVRAGNSYRAPCAELTSAHWWLELGDDAGGWLLRQRLHGTLAEPVSLGAAPPSGMPPP